MLSGHEKIITVFVFEVFIIDWMKLGALVINSKILGIPCDVIYTIFRFFDTLGRGLGRALGRGHSAVSIDELLVHLYLEMAE